MNRAILVAGLLLLLGGCLAPSGEIDRSLLGIAAAYEYANGTEVDFFLVPMTRGLPDEAEWATAFARVVLVENASLQFTLINGTTQTASPMDFHMVHGEARATTRLPITGITHFEAEVTFVLDTGERLTSHSIPWAQQWQPRWVAMPWVEKASTGMYVGLQLYEIPEGIRLDSGPSSGKTALTPLASQIQEIPRWEVLVEDEEGQTTQTPPPEIQGDTVGSIIHTENPTRVVFRYAFILKDGVLITPERVKGGEWPPEDQQTLAFRPPL